MTKCPLAGYQSVIVYDKPKDLEINSEQNNDNHNSYLAFEYFSFNKLHI